MRASTLLKKTDYTVELNDVIEDFLARNTENAGKVSPYYQALWTELSRLLNAGGKRLRPRLAILAYQTFGGQDVPSILPIAAAQELIHLGMLIHDDIIDRDYVRYGVDNIAGGFNKIYQEFVSDKTDRLHYAHSAAMLAGDSMLSSAYLLIGESKIEPTNILEVQRIFGRGVFEVIGGELIDTESAFRNLGDVKSETVALYKTASYTFVAPMLVGAVLAGATKADQANIRVFAENIGIAFQLQDDIIGVFGDEEVTGKSTIGDIREGKRTYIIEQFCAMASKEDRLVFDRYFGDQSISTDEAAMVKELLIKSGARKRTEEAIATYEKNARNALKNLTIDQASMDQLELFITIATKRKK